jgi:imidazolonepropionase-like amidohydrolase
MFHAFIKCSFCFLFIFFFSLNVKAQGNTLLLQNMFLIDGNGGPPVKTSMLIRDGMITAIGNDIKADNTQVLNLSGKFVMPALISSHGHIGNVKGTTAKAANYTRDNILAQLKKYQRYGVGNILVMGTDHPMLFASGLRDSSVNNLLPGARIYSAGYGFNVPQNVPKGGPMEYVFRPAYAAQVPAEMDTLAALHVDVVKMWVDDFGGSTPKMQPEVYKAIIDEAHKHSIRVASHLYYLSFLR